MKINHGLTPARLTRKIERLFELSAQKVLSIERTWKPEHGTPVFTARGKYTSRGWTEWTQGFQYGSALLQFDATGDEQLLEIGRRNTVERMAPHVSHIGVHDHGFNNVSTYGNLWRLMREGKIPHNERENDFYELALKISGAVQAARWTKIADGTGFIHSFNGAHSLFVDTIRSCRALAVGHQLGHVLMGEQDAKHSLLQRLLEHALNTARYNVYYGKGRDAYDLRGRTAHEAVFNVANGVFRCPNSQQGYSPFSTWTRGLAWALCGFAEELEFLSTIPQEEIEAAANAKWAEFKQALAPGKPPKAFNELYEECCAEPAREMLELFAKAATATADFYIENTCRDGIPMWDTGAPNLHRLGNYLGKDSDPFNAWEPVDSSAAAIAAQGLIRLGNLLIATGRPA
jgi:unsaturated chondroitin disaccharide hydrolase